ncbi:hypothetical protein [Mycolicibacterium sp. 120270]|nr:hypothetical protein [Mycolicibacterium sp. 120270]MDX1886083.1 hypothetical protein [Mycolicibacterium sp. 120270]
MRRRRGIANPWAGWARIAAAPARWAALSTTGAVGRHSCGNNP